MCDSCQIAISRCSTCMKTHLHTEIHTVNIPLLTRFRHIYPSANPLSPDCDAQVPCDTRISWPCRELAGHWDNSSRQGEKRWHQLSIKSVSDSGFSISPPLSDDKQRPKGFSPAASCCVTRAEKHVNSESEREQFCPLVHLPTWTIHDGLHLIFQLQICLPLSAGMVCQDNPSSWASESGLRPVTTCREWTSYNLQLAFHLWQTFYIQHSTIFAVGSVNSLVHLDIPVCFMGHFVSNKGRTAALGDTQQQR